MIEIWYIYKSKLDKNYHWGEKKFSSPRKALAFMYKFKDVFMNFEWVCENPEDNEYLWRHFKP